MAGVGRYALRRNQSSALAHPPSIRTAANLTDNIASPCQERRELFCVKVVCMIRSAVLASLSLSACLVSLNAAAQEFMPSLRDDVAYTSWQFSPWTVHFHPSPEHKHALSASYEQTLKDNHTRSVVLFTNSFGQPSVYFSPWGQRFDNLLGQPNVFAKWNAGLIYGYRGEYKDKVPFNHGGFSPGLFVALGYRFTPQMEVQVNLLGTAAIQFQYNMNMR